MPTYDGIGSSITHRVEVVGDSLFQDVDGGTLSTKVPVQIFSNYYASPGSVDSSRQLRFRVQPDGESNVSNSYVTDMGVKGADGSNYFFITAPQNTSNVGDQNTFVISTTGNVGIGTTSPAAPIEIVSTRTTNTWAAGQSYMNILHDNGSSAYYGMSFGVSSSRGNGCIQTFNKNSGGVAYALELQPGGGRVGIGTTVPDVPFDVYGVYSNQIAYFRYPQNPAYIRIIGDQSACLIGADGSGFSAAEPTSIAIFNTGTGYINLLTNGARRALLTGAGQFQAQSFGIYSDKRLKDNITDIDDENSLEIIRNLKPKTFVTKEIKDVKRWGFVADEVEEIVPEAIETNSSSDQYIKKSYDATWLPDGTVSALITDEVFEVGDCLKLTPDLNGLKICSVHVKSVSENVYTFEDAGCMVADDMDIKDLADDTQIHIRSKQIHNVKVLNREFIDPVMVSAMQQMLRRIESLEARLATFENNSA